MLSVFHGTGTELNALQVESHLIPPLAFKVGTMTIDYHCFSEERTEAKRITCSRSLSSQVAEFFGI